MDTSDYNMFDEFSFRGKWWLPELPQATVTGELTFSSNGIRLRLDSPFPLPLLQDPWKMFKEVFKASSVLGETLDGQRCTVLRAFATKVSGHELELKGNRFVLGSHISNEENSFVDGTMVNFTSLEQWGFHPLSKQAAGDDAGSFNFVFPSTSDTILELNDAAPFQSLKLLTGPQLQMKPDEFVARRRSHFLLRFLMPTSILQAQDYLKQIGNLLTLFVGETVLPKKVRFITNEGGQEQSFDLFMVPVRIPQREKDEFEMWLPL